MSEIDSGYGVVYYGGYGHVYLPMVDDANPDEADGDAPEALRFPPVVRIRAGTADCPLFFFFANEARTLNASDSYQQRITGEQEPGNVASYSWSGGGTSSTRTYTLTTPGIVPISCTVTDSLGTSSTGYRWAFVCNRTGSNGPVPILSISGMTESLNGNAFGGCSCTVRVPGSYINTLRRGMAFTIFSEEGVSTIPVASGKSAGEVFSGFIESMSPIIDWRGTMAFEITVSTPERSLLGRESMDGGIAHLFENKSTLLDLLGTTDPLLGSILPEDLEGLVSQSPWHIMDPLTVGRLMHHVVRYHLRATVDGTTYNLIDVIGYRSDWWNLGTDVDWTLDAAALQDGPILPQLQAIAPQFLFELYCSRTSELTFAVSHYGKTTLDPVVGTHDETHFFEVRPVDGESDNVKQVIIWTAPAASRLATDETATYVWPSPANATGRVIKPRIGYYLATEAAGEKAAKTIYDDERSRAMVEFHQHGRLHGIHNTFLLTLTGYANYPWTSKRFQVERVIHETTGAGDRSFTPHKTRVIAREVLRS